MGNTYRAEYELLAQKLQDRGTDVVAIKERLKKQSIETPSWGYADSGTRFGVFKQPGAAVTIEEKIEDAAQVHRFTGVTPSVALHVLWDLTGDYSHVKRYAEEHGLRIGAINPNTFQDAEYRFGSLTHRDPAIRERATRHMLDCVEIAKELGSNAISLWFADGTNYPGQADFRKRKHWAQECLQRVYDAMPPDMVMLIEYKPFEPAFYHTDFADWGMSYVFAQHCGEQAKVLVDLGHHLHGTNIEHIVAFLLDEGRLGGFHFNNRKYADDDMTVSSINPYELFLIYTELVKAENDPNDRNRVAYMIDQSHNIEPKIDAMIKSVMAIQAAYAKALLVDWDALAAAQEADDVIAAEVCLREAFETDVSPLLKVVREEMGLDPHPLEAFRKSGYKEKIARERGTRQGAGGLGQG